MKVLPPRKCGNLLLAAGEYLFVAVGTVALGYWASVTVHSHLFQIEETQHLGQEGRTQGALRTKEARLPLSDDIEQQAPAKGTVIATLAIPRLNLSTVVVEGVGDDDLKIAAGHIPGTALPGESGNIGIAAHRDTFFRPLRLIHKDDVIVLNTPHGKDQYRVVSSKIVAPDDVQVLYPTGRDTLTLVTCYPFYYLGAAPKRFIVRAERDKTTSKESAVTAPLTMEDRSVRGVAVRRGGFPVRLRRQCWSGGEEAIPGICWRINSLQHGPCWVGRRSLLEREIPSFCMRK
jgi:sortase A